jgi:hypothetical protein
MTVRGLFTLSVSAAIIRRQIGVLAPGLQVHIQQRLRTLFGL